ncbi:MAG: tRNA uridine-5-carboxymethylaminomethyl(34) synthesis GTPase MnmE [Gammaproteobacteria bacterium]|nr:tRNA uridine-5-carboxymethylaminomethyl(34) synthesis GTPase MnmE [Gammaproteobacteria bacterium]
MSADVDTIAAIATAPGGGAIGIVRVSGPGAAAIAKAITRRTLQPRHAHFAQFHDYGSNEIIDAGLVLLLPGPGSYSGEDMVEFQAHGSGPVLEALLAASLAAGARQARPGEFTERAFLNGRLDLAQAEAVADLIAAGSRQSARAALASLRGVFSDRVAAVNTELIAQRTLLEACLDFPDEDTGALEELAARLAQLHGELAGLRAAAGQGRVLNDGLDVAIIGAPNVGKSTLLNRLAGFDRAIVSELPGTTRDTVEQPITLDGIELRLIDTAGLRDSGNVIEQEGIRRSHAALERAALVLVVDESGAAREGNGAIATRDPEAIGVDPAQIIYVHNKIDLDAAAPGRVKRSGSQHVRVSALTGAGMDGLHDAMREAAGLAPGETEFSARRRHLDGLDRAMRSISAALNTLAGGGDHELVAEDLRQAHQALGELTGRFTSEDLLGEIFAGFCIGK